MIHSYKKSSYSTSHTLRDYHFAYDGDGRGVVGPRKTHFYLKKYNFVRYRHDGAFHKSQQHHTAPPMALFRSRDYPVGASDGSLFGVDARYGKYGAGPMTTHITSQELIVVFMARIFFTKE